MLLLLYFPDAGLQGEFVLFEPSSCFAIYKVSPGERWDDMPPPMAVLWWQKSRRIYVHPRMGPQSSHLGGRRWLS